MKPKKKRPCRHNIGGYEVDPGGNVWCFKCKPIRCVSDTVWNFTPLPAKKEQPQ